ncbi:MAG: serine/threonine-protein kinase [Myxococcales bacterium]|nr:serine/threonine-protein kinase [Myxococcales bacterium]
MSSQLTDSPRSIGRYLMAGPIAVGGMASVHLGRLEGTSGFRRTVVIKRMLASSSDTEARAMLLDEAHLASRIQHANVVQTLDIVEDGPELFIVLEYVHGESFDVLLKRAMELGQRCPSRIATAIVAGALRGLHAAHEAKGEDGQPLELVHRDFSPSNVLVGADGVPRVLDFGVARARGRMQGTRDGQIKGKLAYLSPEQVHGEASRRSDVFAAGIVCWEALTGRRLFDAPSEAEVLSKVLLCRVPSLEDEEGGAALQAVLDRSLEREPEARFSTAMEMAQALEAAGVASTAEVASWVTRHASTSLQSRQSALEALDRVVVAPVEKLLAPPRSRVPVIAGVVAVALVTAGAALFWPRQELVEAPRAVLTTPSPRPTPDAPPKEPAPEPVVTTTPKPVFPKVATPLPPNVKPEVDRCNPPFTIDSNGVKQFKVECLK